MARLTPQELTEKATVASVADIALEHLLRAVDRGASSASAQADALTSIAASLYLLVKKP